MATAFGFDMGAAPEGAVFALSAAAKKNRRHASGSWEAELRAGSGYVCVRGTAPDLNKPLATVAAAAHAVAEDLLDIVAVEDRSFLLVAEPHDNFIWRAGPQGLKAQLTTSIIFKTEPLEMRGVAMDAGGNVIPGPPYMPPPHHAAYRYFRYSQGAQNVFDAYRNMFLAFESLLDHIASKRPGEAETAWLERALGVAVQLHAADLTPFVKTPGRHLVASFIDAHYTAVRCAVFHAKKAGERPLRPGALDSHDIVLHQLLAVQKLVEGLLKALFAVRLPSGGLFHSGFGHLLSQLAPVVHLLVGPVGCPTVEQLVTQAENLPQGGFAKVRFEGVRPGTTDEWLFSSEMKCAGLDFTHVGALRLIAHVADRAALGAAGMFLVPMMDKMNGTSLSTDLDLQGLSKLVVRVRCVLRNAQEARRGFAA